MLRLFHRRHSKPGTSPGTLRPPEVRRVEQVSLAVLHYDGTSVVEEAARSLEELDAVLARLRPDGEAPAGVLWIDVLGLHEVDLLAALGERFGVHPLALEDVVNTGQRPKAEDYEGALFLVMRHFHCLGSEETSADLAPEQISLFVRPGLVLTFQEAEGDAFEPVRERIRRASGRIATRGSDYLAYALLDALVDGRFPLLERLGEQIEDLEEELISDPTPESLQTLYRLRRDLLLLRRAAWPERELLGSLVRGDSPLFGDETRVFLRDCYDHAVEALEILETYRELAAGMLDVYLSSVSQRMNEVMKVLTIIATIFIPLTFIAGVYGMNFQNMPELRQPWGYPAIWILMIAIALALVAYFRRKDWL